MLPALLFTAKYSSSHPPPPPPHPLLLPPPPPSSPSEVWTMSFLTIADLGPRTATMKLPGVVGRRRTTWTTGERCCWCPADLWPSGGEAGSAVRRLFAVKHELFVPVSGCSHVGKVSKGCFVLLFVANLLFSPTVWVLLKLLCTVF